MNLRFDHPVYSSKGKLVYGTAALICDNTVSQYSEEERLKDLEEFKKLVTDLGYASYED